MPTVGGVVYQKGLRIPEWDYPESHEAVPRIFGIEINGFRIMFSFITILFLLLVGLFFGYQGWEHAPEDPVVTEDSSQNVTLRNDPFANARWIKSVQTIEQPCGRFDHTMSQTNDSQILLVFGGLCSGFANQNDLWKLNTQNNEWSELSNTLNGVPIVEMNSHTAVYYTETNEMIVYGGRNGAGNLNRLFRYDIESDTWSEDIPVVNNAEVRHMFGHTAILNGNIMYIFGGTNGTHVFDSFYQYNLVTKQWSEVVASNSVKPSARYYHGASFVNNKMFVYGGFDTSALGDLWVFDFSSFQWSQLFSSAPLEARSGHLQIEHETYIFIFGGESAEDGKTYSLNDLWVYDTEANDFYKTNVANGPSDRLGPKGALVVNNGNLFVLFGGLSLTGDGTWTPNVYYNDHWYFSL